MKSEIVMCALCAAWGYLPPDASPLTLGCLMESGSLTERLVGSGRRFSVRVLWFGPDAAASDEAPQLGLATGAPMTVRHVALQLDGEDCVVARSFCRLDCPVWQPILDRGGRSLGLTLFSGEVALIRGELEYALPPSGHPLHELAAACDASAAGYPARRCRFVLDGAPLVVCEAFLPSLDACLATAQGRRLQMLA
jgi:chorismate--pyruvate lyase